MLMCNTIMLPCRASAGLAAQKGLKGKTNILIGRQLLQHFFKTVDVNR